MLLVTGAAGYLGSALVDLLVRRGEAVLAAVRDPGRAADVLPEGVELTVADLADPGDGAALRAAAWGCAGVLHLAGSVGNSPDETRRSNVEGTRAVPAAAADAGVPRFVYTSSSAAVIDASGLESENPSGPPALTDVYSTSKAEAEKLVLAAAADGLHATIVNPVSLYGPSPRGPLSYNGLFLAAARGEIDAVVDAPMAGAGRGRRGGASAGSRAG